MYYLRPFCIGLLLLAFGAELTGQGTPMPTATPTDSASLQETPPSRRDQSSMIEVGITPNYSFLSSDVESQSGYGLGIHARKSLDHLFSLRADGLYSRTRGDNDVEAGQGNRRHETTWLSGTGFGVVTLNNFNFNGDIRNLNVYLMAGAGFNFVEAEFQCDGTVSGDGCAAGTEQPWVEGRNGEMDSEFQTHAAFGTGINFRISPRFNLGIEYQALIPLGNRADRVDGYDFGDFRDVQNIAGIALNFNIGNADTQTEPRYWTNAFTPVKEDIAALNKRVDAATTDNDGDGIVNSVDQEPDTPTGVPVDSRGRTLDSDTDGVPDFRDLEPFFPPRQGEVVNADGVVVERNDAPLSATEIQTLIDTSIARYDRDQSTRINTSTGAIYLPMIYFPLNSDEISYDDYGVLASIARVIQANPSMRLVVRGYTDRTGDLEYNTRLSYRRATAVINHLVDSQSIERDRLILQYRGQDEAIVPRDRSRVNRRVEFLTAGEDATEDAPPAGMD